MQKAPFFFLVNVVFFEHTVFLWNCCKSICAAVLRLAVLDKLVCPYLIIPRHVCDISSGIVCELGLISAISSVRFVTSKLSGSTGNTGWLLTQAGPSPPAEEVRWKTLQLGDGEARDIPFRIGVNVFIKIVC